MRDLIVGMIQAGLRPFGAKLARLHPEREEGSRVASVAAEVGAGCILDVGANLGQFASEVFRSGWLGQVISFEPLAQEHAALTATAEGHPRWRVAPRGALGEVAGSSVIHRAGNSASSSLLAMRQEHIEAAAHSAPTGSESIEIRRLDAIDIIPRDQRLFLKIDTQGFEMPVIRGASGLLPQIGGMLVEISFAQLYEGQALAFEVLTHLVGAGFRLHDLTPGFYHPINGRMLQANIIVIH
jgi:FkbM family methyltransferase